MARKRNLIFPSSLEQQLEGFSSLWSYSSSFAAVAVDAERGLKDLIILDQLPPLLIHRELQVFVTPLTKYELPIQSADLIKNEWAKLIRGVPISLMKKGKCKF